MSKTMQNSIQTRKRKLLNSMNKSQKSFYYLTLIVIGPFQPNLTLFSPNNPYSSMKELEFHSDQKTKVA